MIRVIAGGDTLGRTKDGKNPFYYVNNIFERADFKFLNLETVLTKRRKPKAKKWIHLKTDPSAVEYFKDTNINIVNVAHNHILDFGEEGFKDTLKYLKEADIIPIGAGITPEEITHPKIFFVDGLRVIFIGFFMYEKSDSAKNIFIASFEDKHKILSLANKLKKKCDILIISLHWGIEHIFHPSPEQIKFAHNLIDNGVNLILGHHNHCVQGFERYKNGLIAYSLGNFNFWQPDIRTRWFNRLSVVLDVKLTKKGIESYKLIPIWIKENYSPKPIENAHKKNMSLNHFGFLSESISSITWEKWYEEMGKKHIFQSLKSFILTIPKYGWCRIEDMMHWIKRNQTKEAFRGAIRNFIKGLK